MEILRLSTLIVAAWVFQTGIAINIAIAPGICWQFSEQLIPASRSRVVLRLGHQRLQTLFRCWIKTVHAFVELQLCLDRLDVGLNAHGFGDGSRIAEF